MNKIKVLSDNFFRYLDVILFKNWSRYVFLIFNKSDMLLNNGCESFNYVLKDVKDKFILIYMEWMRRYIMKINFVKLQGM